MEKIDPRLNWPSQDDEATPRTRSIVIIICCRMLLLSRRCFTKLVLYWLQPLVSCILTPPTCFWHPNAGCIFVFVTNYACLHKTGSLVLLPLYRPWLEVWKEFDNVLILVIGCYILERGNFQLGYLIEIETENGFTTGVESPWQMKCQQKGWSYSIWSESCCRNFL